MNVPKFAKRTADVRAELESVKPLPPLVLALALDVDEPVPYWPTEKENVQCSQR